MATAAIGLGLTGLSALAGLFSKPKPQVSDTTSHSSTMPLYDDKTNFFKNYLMDLYGDRLRNSGDFESGYKTSGLFNLADASRRSSAGVENILSSRGIDRTTAGANALADNSYRSGNSMASFLNSLPAYFDERRATNLNQAGAFLTSLPTGSVTDSTSHSVGTPSTTGGGLSGLIGGGASGLATYLGQLSANKQLGDILKSIQGAGIGGAGAGLNV